jgi:TolB-like protein
MHIAKKPSFPSKGYPPGSFVGKLRKRRIIETFIAFVAGGVAAVEFVYHIIFHYYHFPRYTVDITIIAIMIAMLCTLAWRWFRREREEGTEEPKTEPISFPEWKKSIVVLPFDNISPEEAQDYFCDGMTEEIITDLSSIHDLRVISRSSAMMLKGSKKAVRDIAKELNVQYVLEGSARKAGNDIRITAQLIDATSDAHLWADKYSGKLDDVFDLQEEVSRKIADALKLKLSPKEDKYLAERSIDNVKVYEYYLKAIDKITMFTEDSVNRALRYLQNAVDIMGDNALLYSAMAFAYWNLVNIGAKQEDYLAKAEEYAKKALL